MKRFYLSFYLMSMAIISIAQNKKVDVGMGAGVNFAYMTYSSNGFKYTPYERTGFNGYVFVGFPFSSSFSLKSEFGYIEMGNNVINRGPGYNFPDETTILNYVTLSVLPQLNVIRSGLSFFIGPSFGYKVFSKAELHGVRNISIGGDGRYYDDDYNSTDLFGVVGAEYFLHCGIGLSVRYLQGLTNIGCTNYQKSTVHNRAITLSFVYKFKFQKK